MNITEKAHVIVVGNEKGGTGKSTVSMHLIVSLLNDGYRVASIDLDGRQSTLTRYIQNRVAFSKTKNIKLHIPEHLSVTAGDYVDDVSCRRDEECLAKEIERLSGFYDVIVIDTPGSNNHLFRAGHRYANTLVTPMNDSLIDLDVLARVDTENAKIISPSHYSEMIWETRKQQAVKGYNSFQWIVLRNRLLHLDTHNKRKMSKLLNELSGRIGFKQLSGLGERVIYRELFLKGLTVFDLREKGIKIPLSVSHVAARQELRTLIDSIGLKNRISTMAS